MKTFIVNAFSLNMLDVAAEFHRLTIHLVNLERAREFAAQGAESAVGHPDSAAIFAEQLGVPVPVNRINLSLVDSGTRLLVGQYTGPRLEPGARTLPPGAIITWWLVVHS